MKIYNSDKNSLWEALGLEAESHPVISVVGAGGKTSILQTLSEELSDRGLLHGVMTTTHMWPMAKKPFRIVAGRTDASGKLCRPGSEELEGLLSRGIPILIEADGSKGLACKAPESWEPVILPETTHVIGVLGVSCLGKVLKRCCHRPERVMALLKTEADHRMETEDLRKLILSSEGLRKNVGSDQYFGVVLNQIDNEEIYEQVRSLNRLVLKEGIDRVIFTCFKKK